MVSGVSILNFCALRNRFKLLRSSIGLHLLLGFGTKNSLLRTLVNCVCVPVLLHFCS